METIRLGDACEILNGYAFKSENYVDSGIRVIRIANVQKGFIEDNTPAFYPLDSIGLDKYMLEEGDLLMSLTGNVGRIAILEKEFMPAALNQRVACLRLKTDRITKGYLFHILNSDFFEQQCIKSSKGVAQKNMSTEWLKDYEIPVYSKEKQAEIASILDKTRNVIACRNLELQKLDELIKARFVEMFGECKNEVLIGDVISICRGASPRPIQSFITDDEDGVNWIKIGDVSENSLYITQTAERITQEGAKKSRAVHKGDFILSNSMSFGRPYILGIDGCVHDGWLILSEFRETFDELYLYHALRSEHVQHQFSGKVNGATVKNLNSDLVKATYIQVPDMETQYEFTDFVKQVDKSKFAA